MEPLYRVVFTGDLLAGQTVAQVVAAFTARFQVEEAQARRLIEGGGRTLLKQDLTRAEAEHYLSVLAEVGLRVSLEPQEAPKTTPQTAPQTAPPPPPSRTPDPGARLLPGRTATGAAPGGTQPPPRGLPAGHGAAWIGSAWGAFARQPWAWIGASLLYLLLVTLIGLLPVVGGLILTIAGPIFSGGLMIGAQAQAQGGRFAVGHLFAGFSQRPGPLALVGLAYLVLVILTVLVIGVVIGIFMALMDAATLEGMKAGLDNPDLFDPLILIPVLLATLAFLPIVMAVVFAPPLVALDGATVSGALRLSLAGCWRNLLPLLIFSLIALVLGILSIFTLGLGLLVVMPWVTIAWYLAYRDIYHGDSGH